ncbi:LuxR family transcriptional regulator [Mesorhizobium sp. M1342]|uniref:LuxR family transcriptional regulator n=1 Tax=Mesorhizobium sp. M1342 TaxID=2957088 RepID=UPI00333D2872
MHSKNSASPPVALEFGRFLDQAEGVAGAEQLFDLLSDFARNFECPWIAYCHLTQGKKSLKADQHELPVMLTYPEEWQKRYFKMGFDRIDPIIKKSRKRAAAFRWSDVYNDANTTEDERRFLEEASRFGLGSSLTVPLHGPDGNLSVMTFSRSCEYDFLNSTITYLSLAALHFHTRTTWYKPADLIDSSSCLSLREKDCILWTARGKSSWEIGVILGISKDTVNFHIKNAMRKFDVNSRTAAATKALKLGIIDI